ncbi:hypothetical protein FIU09_10005 [Stenotrophomonas maltophilia]|nr:hypothetical protein AVW14_09810 [Stenotrophomonas maltophilia]MCF3545813.1 hypothetical protein [Stenotrophomonas maltophilia]TNY00599.1 hypothetical protein FIU09_10005 [Stenotrophomonas maltophilia]TPD77257.1 hypothetical protein FJN21_11605 [Stenotrophomonas maltophilia]TPD82725.1 hypothetical protein FJN19_11000 [Stenotrophomonas maltophilia]
MSARPCNRGSGGPCRPPFTGRTAVSIKEQITTDLAVAGSKIGAAASATAATYSPGYTLSDWALTGAIVFTVVQMFTVRLKNWGDWSAWWSARMGNAKRLWTWIRRPG